jgi:hypothetical protein
VEGRPGLPGGGRSGHTVHNPTPHSHHTTPSGTVPAVTTRRAPIWAIAAAAIIAATAATGITIWTTHDSDTKPATTEVEVAGTITLSAGHFVRTEIDCSGSGGYGDLVQGAQVTITDPAGKVIAIGKLGYGKTTMAGDRPVSCTFPFHTYAAAGHGIYGVEVTHRGVVQVPEANLGKVALTIG